VPGARLAAEPGQAACGVSGPGGEQMHEPLMGVAAGRLDRRRGTWFLYPRVWVGRLDMVAGQAERARWR
jgi:hypothetical protein